MRNYDNTVNEIRKFNRFYTVNMGFLNSGYLDTDYSIAEIRILFEIKMRENCIQSDITKSLHIDKSYLSRLIKRLCKIGLVEKNKSDRDKRAAYIMLSEKGKIETQKLIELTNNQIQSKISDLSDEECDELCNALNKIISILDKGE